MWVVFRAVYICYQRLRVSESYGLGKVGGLCQEGNFCVIRGPELLKHVALKNIHMHTHTHAHTNLATPRFLLSQSLSTSHHQFICPKPSWGEVSLLRGCSFVRVLLYLCFVWTSSVVFCR